ncbi:hypothetical protein AB0D67_00185 [Streptosporangium sp. NPDC048047]|uniref:hypothetical protein n=1 Tax=Streptosporangium sp. NPDC048047 TaxID=3155748 RepID=UPI00342DEBFE
MAHLESAFEYDCAEVDCAEIDRRQRGIVLHMVLSLLVGMLLGTLGAVLSHAHSPLDAFYEPYAYVLLVVVAGYTAAGLGWAVLSCALATFGPLLSLLAATVFDPGAMFLGAGGAEGLNITVAALVVMGVLAHLSRNGTRWGDLAGGVLAGLVALDGLDKALPGGPEYIAGFWPWKAVVVGVLALGLLVTTRRGWGRARSAAVAVAMVAVCAAFL